MSRVDITKDHYHLIFPDGDHSIPLVRLALEQANIEHSLRGECGLTTIIISRKDDERLDNILSNHLRVFRDLYRGMI